MVTRMFTGHAAVGPPVVSTWRRRLGWAAVAVWAGALIWFCLQYGVPFDRAYQTMWILAGLAAASVGRPWRQLARTFLDWVPFVLILYLYDYSRGAADLLGGTVQVEGPLTWDRALFLGADPTVWLQQNVYDPQTVHWWEAVGALVYCSHFLVAWVIAAVLYLRDRDHWFRWARAVIALSFAALVTYALMPSAPPWYAAREGYLPPVDRIATRGLDPLGQALECSVSGYWREEFAALGRQSIEYLAEEISVANPRLVVTLGAEVAGVIRAINGPTGSKALLGGDAVSVTIGSHQVNVVHLAHPGIVMRPSSGISKSGKPFTNKWPALNRDEHIPRLKLDLAHLFPEGLPGQATAAR